MSTNTVRTALVTGAGARIGRAIALGLAGKGWAVAVHYHHSDEAAQETAGEIRRLGGRAAAVAADLADEAEVASLVTRSAAALGAPVTCLVNNASVFERDDIQTVTRESWDLHLDVNLRAPLVLVQQLAAQLPGGEPGNVINIIDQRVWRLTPAFLSYTVSKAGLWTLTQTLAQALGPRIRVNAIGPGPTLPNTRQAPEDFQAQVQALPLQRGPALEEFVAATCFLLEAGSVTGQMIALDGGQHLAWQTPDVMGVE